jgi:hypothetical protein
MVDSVLQVGVQIITRKNLVMSLFSQRQHLPTNQYRYDFPSEARSRFLYLMQNRLGKYNLGFGTVLNEVGNFVLEKEGGLRRPAYEAARMSDDPVIQHFFSSDDFKALDFVQFCFSTEGNCGGQEMVDAVNTVFDETGMGYELTPVVYAPQTATNRRSWSSALIPRKVEQAPRIIRKDEKFSHQEIVQPTLHVLSDSRFASANRELLEGIDKLRLGEWADSITSCGAAIESALKTICTAKGWPYDPHKDTCSKLLDICREKGLFHPFYKPILEGTATIRNKVGDAHGKGPHTEFAATKELAQHMVHTCCSNIALLVSLAKL